MADDRVRGFSFRDIPRGRNYIAWAIKALLKIYNENRFFSEHGKLEVTVRLLQLLLWQKGEFIHPTRRNWTWEEYIEVLWNKITRG